MWQELDESGFLDALVGESQGGAGLTLAEIASLISALGAHAVPLPVAETMVARALLVEAGAAVPQGPIALATSSVPGTIVPCGIVADHVLVDTGEQLVLAGKSALSSEPLGIPYSLAARLSGAALPSEPSLPRPIAGLRPIAAVLRATLIAGAVERVTTMTAAYANERVQFGKPIGRQQAVQQNMALMAEDLVATRIAAQLACAAGLGVTMPAAATAKSVASAAAGRVAAFAHAVHGAIGVSEEYDLQLLTRRLYEWRLADGSAKYWDTALGEARLSDDRSTVDWARGEIFGDGPVGGQDRDMEQQPSLRAEAALSTPHG
jgi:acyl-CoA dehydrogenase